MRIGIFSESYEPIVNGVSVFVGTLRDELSRRGHQVFIFAPAYKGHTDESDNVFRFPSVHTFLQREYPFPVPFSPKLGRTFKSLNLDVVHTQTPFLLGWVGARWARRCGVPLVSTNHTLYTEYAHYVPVLPKALTRAYLIGLMRRYYSGCDALVVPSKPVEKLLRSYGVKTPVEVIKTGVVPISPLPPQMRREVRRQHGINEDDFLLLYVGRVAREKNLTMLLDAFQAVSNAHSHGRLMVVGGGPALEETQALASQKGLSNAVQFTGPMPRREIDPIFAAADAFVFPSTTETQGIAICEALSAHLPVVAVNAGGIPENVADGVDGFLTNDDAEEFADKISFLITHDAQRQEMAAKAGVNSAGFSIERMVGDFEKFYAAAVAGRVGAVSGPTG